LEGTSIGLHQKKKELMIWRIKMQARVQGKFNNSWIHQQVDDFFIIDMLT
jgi:hypothetical protein